MVFPKFGNDSTGISKLAPVMDKKTFLENLEWMRSQYQTTVQRETS
ncbi:MAG: hypothetical protein MUD14_25555 [Hydrococcus sp. Prado102]|nr:hypothetical protein [Hydrococcus sp. Prado102]